MKRLSEAKKRRIYNNAKNIKIDGYEESFYAQYQFAGGKSDVNEFEKHLKKFEELGSWGFCGDPPPDDIWEEYKDLLENTDISYKEIVMIIFEKYLRDNGFEEYLLESDLYYCSVDSISACS